MNGILLALLLTSTTPSFDAVTLDGRTVVGPIEELTAERLTIASKTGRVSIPITGLLAIASKQNAGPVASSPGIIVELTDGSLVHASRYIARGNQARITLTNDDVVQLPTSIVQTVLCGASDNDALRTEWSRLMDMKTDSDLLVVRSGNSLDYHRGVMHDVTDDSVRFDLDGEILPIKRSKLYGFAYRRAPATELPPSLCRITDTAGSQWPARSLSLALRLQWTTPAGVTVSQPLENISRLDFSEGKLVYLSDMKPDLIEWTPFFGATKPLSTMKRLYAPRFDRGFDSLPLRLGDVQYQKGLALHTRTEIVYRLPERFRRFAATVGIADSVRPGGKVRLVIRGDDKVLLDAGFSGGDAPRPIDLDLSGIRRLTIIADFDDGLSVGSELLLCNARVVK